MQREIATSRPIPRIEDANIVIFDFAMMRMADESQICTRRLGQRDCAPRRF